MVNKTISMDYQLYMLLQEEENASALISNLLREHYQTEKKQILVVDPDVFDVMDKSVKVIQKEEETQSLRDAVLSTLTLEEQNKLINEKQDA